jgi:PAS domain S-box-containing protein
MGIPVQHASDDAMDMGDTMGGDTLDDIIMQNNKEIQRRQSITIPYAGQAVDRRSSMMEFGATNSELNSYQFSPNPTGGEPSLRRQSAGELEIARYSEMGSAINLQSPHMGFASSMQTSEPLNIDTGAYPGMSTDMVQGMMGYAPFGMEGISENNSALNMYPPQDFMTFNPNIGPGSGDFMMSGNGQNEMHSHGGSILSDSIEHSIIPSMSGPGVADGNMISSPVNMNMSQKIGGYTSPVKPNPLPVSTSRDSSYSIPPTTAAVTPTSQETETLHVPKAEPKPNQYKNIYSQSGFDMLGALMKVASRQNPEINIGKVDMSCAFVVCDISQADCPIIYVSDIFERLTGYNKHEVLGRNCRFLQSPEGKVQAGARREFVDNNSVYYLRNRIADKKEAQRSLINYRKGGQPFMNLLTMIPITGDDEKEIRYYVGFQVDLVEKPTSVEGKSVNGMYTVDYTQGSLPQYTWQPPEGLRSSDGGQIVSRDDVSTLLTSINNTTESELTKRMWDKVLLENTDDIVHVLSLKGLFLYLSPSCRNILEYDPAELVGTALSSVCHPSDIVPVTRELKDTAAGLAVSVVYRIRRKKSGYTWFESHGTLCIEQGKGRKFIILVGRERPVYALSRHDIDGAGGIGESEMWTKLSTSGMFLFVSSHVRTLLDRSPEELVGTSFQALMRANSKVDFGRSLEKARMGKRVTYKHEVLNKRGLGLQAQTTLYPGDASEGSKPTFLVAQTRLLKASTRAVAPALGSHSLSRSVNLTGRDHQSDDSPNDHPTILGSQLNLEDESTLRSSASFAGPMTQAGGPGLSIGTQDMALASDENIFDELKTTRCTSWQFELRQMEKSNRLLAEELASLLSNKKKRKRRKGAGHIQRDCANCHTRVTPEWRRGPSGQRDLCNSCGLRWAKQVSQEKPEQDSSAWQHGKGRSQSDSSTSRS